MPKALRAGIGVGSFVPDHDGRQARQRAQARQNDARQLKELGVVGRWIRDRLFPLVIPLVARELERQYAALPGSSAEAA
jgi:hypothetical protein